VPKEKKYTNDELIVFWNSETCIHSANCVNSLKPVFNPQAKPWVNMNGASNEEIIKVVENCPSGALKFKRRNKVENQENADAETITVKVNEGGPYLIKGKVKVVNKDGTETVKEGNVALCRCGGSDNKPYCDGTHKNIEFDK
jgi:uncharacterized Fe-S cluster protein YjdI